MDKRIYIHLWKMSFSAQVGYFLELTPERLLSSADLHFWQWVPLLLKSV
jgi:hypothetical protein